MTALPWKAMTLSASAAAAAARPACMLKLATPMKAEQPHLHITRAVRRSSQSQIVLLLRLLSGAGTRKGCSKAFVKQSCFQEIRQFPHKPWLQFLKPGEALQPLQFHASFMSPGAGCDWQKVKAFSMGYVRPWQRASMHCSVCQHVLKKTLQHVEVHVCQVTPDANR